MIRSDFLIGGTAQVVEKKVDGQSKFFLEIFASTADIDLEDDIISGDALRGAQHDLLKNNTVLLGHDRNEILGSTVESLFTAPKSLKLVLLISNTRPKEQQMIRENALNKASIGGRMLNWKEETIEGKKVRVITRIRLHEVSLVSLPANQEARALRWWVDKDGPEPVITLGIGQDFSEKKKGGDAKKMEDPINKDQPVDAPGSPAPEEVVEAGFAFDPSAVDEVGKNVQAHARAMEIREKMLYVTEQLKGAPDEGVAKAAEVLESLINDLPIEGANKSEPTDSRLGKLEGMLADIKGKLDAKAEPAPAVDPAPAAPAAPVAKGAQRPVIRKSAPPQGGDPAPAAVDDPDAALKAELEQCKSREEKFACLRKHGRLSVKVS